MNNFDAWLEYNEAVKCAYGNHKDHEHSTNVVSDTQLNNDTTPQSDNQDNTDENPTV